MTLIGTGESYLLMKPIKIFLVLLCCLCLTNCAGQTQTESPSDQKTDEVEFPYRLYPTQNMWTFIKLDTSNGRMWQVQYSLEGDNYRFEKTLNLNVLTQKQIAGRFELYPTQNIYNFILIDKVSGDTWQVQWSKDEENRVVIPIRQLEY